MNNLILDVSNEILFLMIITNNNIYNITKYNTKINYEILNLIISNFVNSQGLELRDISTIYVNRGPGSFAGIRNSLSVVKAFNVSKNIDYCCFSFDDCKDETTIKYENIPYCCAKFKIKKNLINHLYIS